MNKRERNILELSGKLPAISEAAVKWGYRHCIKPLGRYYKNGHSDCFECGHTWQQREEGKYMTCPSCGKKLEKALHKCARARQEASFMILRAYEGFQVLRIVIVDWRGQVGQKGSYSHFEAIQYWIAVDGSFTFLRRPLIGMNYSRQLDRRRPLTVMPYSAEFEIEPYVYPRGTIIPELRLRGLKKPTEDMCSAYYYRFLLLYPRMETLFKAGQMELLRYFSNPYRTGQEVAVWPALKICIRNKYKVKDAEMYYDYLELLQYFHKDLHNAKYVCPANLKEAHDLYMKRKRRQEREEEERTKRKRLIEDEAAYLQAKGKLLGLQFDAPGGMVIKTLDSVEEVMKEGDVLHHCVYTNRYYEREDSLLLSARVKGKPVETVEVSLSQKKVMQSRGLCNKNSPYHDRIIEQVNRHIGELFVHRGDSLNQ